MFTGIIEHLAPVIGLADGPGFLRLTIAASWPDIKGGESVAINGVCLTVAEIASGEIGFDIVPETIGCTNLGLLKTGDHVHVERSMRIGERLDGHFVQGHVDGTAKLVKRIADDKETRLLLETTSDLAPYLTPKGSVALDGVSLTLAAVDGPQFEIALIPTTLQRTTLASRPAGWPFNLETDILSKTVVNYLRQQGHE